MEFDIEDGDYHVWVRRSGDTVEMSLVDRSEYENAASAELTVEAVRQLRDALTAVLDTAQGMDKHTRTTMNFDTEPRDDENNGPVTDEWAAPSDGQYEVRKTLVGDGK